MSGVKAKVIFFGCRLTSLQCLEQLCGKITAKGSLGLVLNESAPDVREKKEVERLCREYGIKVMDLEDVKRAEYGLGVSVLYDKKISQDIIRNAKTGIVNFHLGPLPRLRGSNSVLHAIRLAREESNWTFGVTLHYIDEKLDTGSVIEQLEFPILETDTAGDLHRRACEKLMGLFTKHIDRLLASNNRVKAEVQTGKARFFRRGDIDHEINLKWPAEKIYDHVRALTFPGKPKPFIKIGPYKFYLTAEKDV